MKRTLIIKSVFCPDKTQFKKSFQGLINVSELIDENVKDLVNLLVIGYVKLEYVVQINKIVDFYRHKFSNVYLDLWSINWGKYKILNQVREHCVCNSNCYDCLLYADHDIRFEGLIDSVLINNLYDISCYIHDGYTVGFVALNQTEDCRHQPDICENSVVINDKLCLYPNNIGSIASGCFFCLSSVYCKVTPLTLKCVYGLDDYSLLLKLYEDKFRPVVVQDITVVHPKDCDNRYKKWKYSVVERLIKCDITYTQSLELAVNFWNGF